MAQNYVLLERIELNASAASVAFSNIPQTGYTDLKVVMSARSTAGGGTNWDPLCYRFNGSTSGYSTRELYGNGSSAGSATNTTITSAGAGGTWGRLQDYGITTSNQTANTFSSIELLIPNYTSSNQKSLSFDSVYETNATAAYAEMVAGIWTGTAAVSSIDFALYTGSFVAGSSFSLYGLADVNTTPTIAPKADGGNVIATDGTYWYHTFLTNGTFIPQIELTADYLVVAGGGGGGSYSAGGGGGAGGLRSTVTATGGGGSLESAVSLSSGTPYYITIGAGGAGAFNTSTGTSGGATSIYGSGLTTISTVGGGYGGGYNGGHFAAATGGSGGGANYATYTTGAAGTANQGYAGGNGVGGAKSSGGGGGGAGAVGGNGSTSNGGNGGNGVLISALATATSTGVSGYYAGGGGGATYDAATAGTGGLGGGGNANGPASVANPGDGYSGVANTGGGGGAAETTTAPPSNARGGAGGSGIIIIRYAMA